MYWPTRSQDIYSDYGYRSKSCGACSSNHLGVDFDHNVGTPIYAAMDGIISRIENKGGFVLAHWDGTSETELKIKDETKATIRCIPLDAKEEQGKCIYSGKPSSRRVLFAKAY